jgi:SAM-dependent methyltransferase
MTQPPGTAPDPPRIALPDPSESYGQDAEWCLVEAEDGWSEVRFHDYDRIYRIPGLYERLFYDILRCCSPRVVCGMLRAELDRAGVDPSTLRVLDLGAGNGIVGAELRSAGVSRIVGVDIIPEAREAALRDRPDVYEDYHVVDMTGASRLCTPGSPRTASPA